jgi:AraC family transcriptional regulator, regulatory protein of adaptative response / methylated-DNA-[protein]-cysteine methyltransferase
MIHLLKLKDFNRLSMRYWYETTPFGRVLIAATDTGICCVTPSPEDIVALNTLKQKFEGVYLEQGETQSCFNPNRLIHPESYSLSFHLAGTSFQLEVWNALLEIPFGETRTYGDIASKISNPKAFRAAGNAVGSNPAFYLIPCHRVLPASGKIGNYLWGSKMKQELIKWEMNNQY